MRTRIMSHLHAEAMNEGWRRKTGLWSGRGRTHFALLLLAPWATRRRQDLLELVDHLGPTIEKLTAAIEQEAKKRPEVSRRMTHPGVGHITALAFGLISPQRTKQELRTGCWSSSLMWMRKFG
jgi:transposase